MTMELSEKIIGMIEDANLEVSDVAHIIDAAVSESKQVNLKSLGHNHNGEYGFMNVNYENVDGHNYECLTIAFGDGLNRVNTLIWPDMVGISIYRDEKLDPFLRVEFSEENPAPEMPDEKIFITFDKVESVDAVIKQLNYIRDELLSRNKTSEMEQDMSEQNKPRLELDGEEYTLNFTIKNVGEASAIVEGLRIDLEKQKAAMRRLGDSLNQALEAGVVTKDDVDSIFESAIKDRNEILTVELKSGFLRE